ncbi:efflux transporter outer membrane subunit [Fundidesulfovibrio soli]|uniref:efflux transporter outer membrane subunit n=1 Tax=Fundidesulfovibrio soli TaxID=2922716 RepID=UPI0023519206|nr:efflux transporter outer membrane subunit [Fundidesulfovibrio soli]
MPTSLPGRISWPRLCLLLCILALSTAGCMKVGPDFKKPETASPKSWMESDYAKTRPDIPPAEDWWKSLNDPVLDNLVATARKQNLTLHIAGVRILEARAQLGIAVGNIYPQTQQGVGALTYNQPSRRAPGSAQPPNDGKGQFSYWQDSAGFQAAWELDFWGKFRRAIESADASLAASVADYDNVLVSLGSDVASTYVLLRVSEERLRIAKNNVVLQKEGWNIADIRFRLGATSERDVMQALTLLSSTEATIPVLTSSVHKARHALALLLGMTPKEIAPLLEGPSRIPECPEQIGVGIPADLLRRRPDVRQAEYLAAAQCANIGVAKADLFPSFSLTGNIGWLSSNMGAFNLADIFSARSLTAGFGPSVTWNLFNYGRIVNNVRVQDARFEAALLNYRNTVLTALKQVEDSLADYQFTRAQTADLARAADAATRGADLAFIQYKEGKTDYTTVIVAQQNQLTQQDALASAQGNIVLGMVGLYRGLGGGWEERPEPVPADVAGEMKARTYWGSMLNTAPEKYEDPAKAPAGRLAPGF